MKLLIIILLVFLILAICVVGGVKTADYYKVGRAEAHTELVAISPEVAIYYLEYCRRVHQYYADSPELNERLTNAGFISSMQYHQEWADIYARIINLLGAK